jgi:sterol desaturase/sphingolipid hydroxylase (fatty acid hydroxylase superfamily)
MSTRKIGDLKTGQGIPMTDLETNRNIESTAGTLLTFEESATAKAAPVRMPRHEATPTWRLVLPWMSFWIIMGLSFWLTAWLAEESRLPNYVWYVMAQGNVLLIVLFEQLIPKNKENSLFRDGQSWNDIGHMLLFKLVWRPLVWMVALSIVTFSASHWHNSDSLWPSYLPGPVQFLLLLLVFDLVGYAYHRTLHRFNYLRAFHAIHHDTRKMHVLKSNRLHFGESVVNFLMLVPAMIIVGCPPAMVIWLGMWEVFEGNLAHSNVDQRFPRWFHYIVRTADVHRIHHSDDGKLQNSNFGGLPIWDVIFRTYRHPFDTLVTTTGIDGDPVPKGFFAQLLFPFVALLRAKVVAPPPLATESPATDKQGA